MLSQSQARLLKQPALWLAEHSLNLLRARDRTWALDIVGENCVRNDASEIALTDEDKMEAWDYRHARLLNVKLNSIHNILIGPQHTSYMIHNINTQITFYRHIQVHFSD